jgi:hypothetical protein
MHLTVSLDAVLSQFGKRIEQAGKNAPQIMADGLNAAGPGLRRATIAAEVAQTGLSKSTISRAQREHRASASHLVYEIAAKGGDVRLKFFKARETKAGVSAAPWNKRQVYEGNFIKGGRFPDRVGIGMGGHVFKRTGAARGPIEGGRSGLFIPKEMTTGQTAAAFEARQGTVLAAVVAGVAKAIGA